MAIEMLNYADLAARLKISPEAARALAKRLRLPRSRGNDGKALVSVDLAEINHAPLPARSPAGHQAVTSLKAKIETLQAELAKLEAVAGGHRADFEWERDQGQKLKAEFLKMIAVTMTAKETAARLEGELASLKARRWRVMSSLNSRAVAKLIGIIKPAKSARIGDSQARSKARWWGNQAAYRATRFCFAGSSG